MKVLISDDVMNIAARVKQIDRDYYILYNKDSSKFEVHNARCNPSLCITLPYPQLDCRTLTHIQKTRIERVEQIIKSIDEHNSQLEKSRYYSALDECKYKSKQLINFINSKREAELPSYNEI